MAYLFGNENNDNISVGNVLYGSNWTIGMWVRFTAVDTTQRTFFKTYGAGVRDIWFETKNGGTNQIEIGFQLSDGGYTGSYFAQWTSGFTAGSWHWVAYTWDGTTMSIFADVDTTAKATATPSLGPLNTGGAPTKIGGSPSGTTHSFDGDIQEVGMWNRVLTADERVTLGNGFAPSTIPRGLTNYWPLVRGATDIRGGFNGTVTGATVSNHTRVIYTNNYQIAPFAAGAGTIVLKTLDGLAQASIKTFQGLASASTKTWNGLSNV